MNELTAFYQAMRLLADAGLKPTLMEIYGGPLTIAIEGLHLKDIYANSIEAIGNQSRSVVGGIEASQ